MRGKTVQCLRNSGVGHSQCLFDGLALYYLSCHRRGSDGRTAAKGLEPDICDNAMVNFEIHFHDVAAHWIAYGTNSVRILNDPHIPRMIKMVHNFIRINHGILLLYQVAFWAVVSQTGDMARR